MKAKILICCVVLLSVFMFLVSSAAAGDKVKVLLDHNKDKEIVEVLSPEGRIQKFVVPRKDFLCPCFTQEKVADFISTHPDMLCSQSVGTAVDGEGDPLVDDKGNPLACTTIVCQEDVQIGNPPNIGALEGPEDAASCVIDEVPYLPNSCLYYEGGLLPPHFIQVTAAGADACIEILQTFLP
jgi:hypothetical protein